MKLASCATSAGPVLLTSSLDPKLTESTADLAMMLSSPLVVMAVGMFLKQVLVIQH